MVTLVSLVILTICYLCPGLDGFSFVPQVYDVSYNTSLVRIRRQNQGSCQDGFQCKTTQECISTDKVCDGSIDCSDGSDEFESLCKEQICPGYLFRCDYGACISSDKRCDGVKDCKDNSDEAGCATQPKINSNCRSDEFECNNGQCISSDSKCNGLAECEDKSDETEELCLNIYCPGYTYKCAYGACVDGDAHCNGIQNCVDYSDEKDCDITTPPTIIPTKPTKKPDGSRDACTAPQQPANGQWISSTSNLPGVAGDLVEKNTIIQFSCNDGYKLSSTHQDIAFVKCLGAGKWLLTEMPQCQKLCPPLYNTETTILQCKDVDSGTPVPCNKATDGTVLTYKCTPYYEPASHTTRNCYDGKWDFGTPSCIPVCGEKRVTATPLVVNGKSVERGNYPWMAALYSNKDQRPNVYTNICGGSLLTTSLVLTAAHCVASDKNGKQYKASYYQVAVGKFYNKYKDERDNDTAQYAEVDRIEVHSGYKGDVQHFRADIAILKLKSPFALSKVVQPVCYLGISDFSLQPFTNGVVTGWGYTTSSSRVADELKELELPYKDYATCEVEFDQEWVLKYFTEDKMCAGHFKQNTSVCKGDSGGGLVFQHPVTRRFFVHGIVSVGPSFKENLITHCDIQKSALFTRVETYFEWLQSRVSFLTRDTLS